MRDDYQSGYENMDYQDPYNQQPMALVNATDIL